MVREQVHVLTEATGKISKDVATLKAGVEKLGEGVDKLSASVEKLDSGVKAFGQTLEAVAAAVDEERATSAQHEARISALEKRMPKKREP